MNKDRENDTNVDEALKFLERLDSNSQKFTIQTFSDNKNLDNHKRVYPQLFYCELEKKFHYLKELNQLGHGIFLTINAINHDKQIGKFRRNKESVMRIRAVFADDDEKRTSFRDDWLIKPSMIIESSSGKYHYYWFCEGVELDEFTLVQNSISEIYGTDPAVSDLPRVMRLPGFFHMKDEPFFVKIVKNNDVCYSRKDILSAFPMKEEKPKVINKIPKHISITHDVESGVSKTGTPYVLDLTWDIHGDFHKSLVLGEEIPTSNAAEAMLVGREDSDNDTACPYSLDKNGFLTIFDFSRGISHHFDEISKGRAYAWKAKNVDRVNLKK